MNEKKIKYNFLFLIIIVLVLFLICYFSLTKKKEAKKTEIEKPVQTIVYYEEKKEEWGKEKKPIKYVAIIMDDVGYNRKIIEKVLGFTFTVNFAVIPYLPNNRYLIDQIKDYEGDLLLHLPMQARVLSKEKIKYKGGIYIDMSDEKIIETVLKDIEAVPFCRGVNNHTGSVATADKRIMSAVLTAIKEKNLYFIDSVTTSKSVGYKTAVELGVPSLKRNLFLDVDVDLDYELIRNNIRKIESMKSNKIVVICHPHEETARALKDEIPLLVEKGIKFVSVSYLLEGEL